MKRIIITAVLLPIILAGCLTVEHKEYRIELSGDGTGTLTVKYENIMSLSGEGEDESADDYSELTTKYLDGTRLADEYPHAVLVEKKLFEENGKLCGLAVYRFKSLSDIRLFRYHDQGPYMMHQPPTSSPEEFVSSNGEYGGMDLPVVFWPGDFQILTLSTLVTGPDEHCTSLLDLHRKEIGVTRK
ncbi:MAG: hypothetical protein JW861_12410 [Bacteroidales bacterium]|nr:hypothetical protein [Bacteroidales bacterium]